MPHESEPPMSVGTALSQLFGAVWNKLPRPAMEALSKFIRGTGDLSEAWLDAGAAKGQQLASTIRTKTAIARIEALSALLPSGLSDELLATSVRGIQHEFLDSLRFQQNRDGVAMQALGVLAEDPPPEDSPPVDDDWMNVFSAFAEKASSDRLRKHWGSVLAGEIRKPGSFSLTALQMLSIMDQHLAQIITDIRPWVLDNNNIPMVQSLAKGDGYTKLITLQAIGFLSMGHSKFYKSSHPYVYYTVGQEHIYVSMPNEVRFAACLITEAGKDVLNIVQSTSDQAFVLEVLDLFKKSGATYAGLSPPEL